MPPKRIPHAGPKPETSTAPKRRAAQFWAPLNAWLRNVLASTGKRPSSIEVAEWYNSSAENIWGSLSPTLHEACNHARSVRSAERLRQYFREYRSKQKDERQTTTRHSSEGGGEQSHPPQDLAESDPAWQQTAWLTAASTDAALQAAPTAFGDRATMASVLEASHAVAAQQQQLTFAVTAGVSASSSLNAVSAATHVSASGAVAASPLGPPRSRTASTSGPAVLRMRSVGQVTLQPQQQQPKQQQQQQQQRLDRVSWPSSSYALPQGPFCVQPPTDMAPPPAPSILGNASSAQPQAAFHWQPPPQQQQQRPQQAQQARQGQMLCMQPSQQQQQQQQVQWQPQVQWLGSACLPTGVLPRSISARTADYHAALSGSHACTSDSGWAPQTLGLTHHSSGSSATTTAAPLLSARLADYSPFAAQVEMQRRCSSAAAGSSDVCASRASVPWDLVLDDGAVLAMEAMEPPMRALHALAASRETGPPRWGEASQVLPKLQRSQSLPKLPSSCEVFNEWQGLLPPRPALPTGEPEPKFDDDELECLMELGGCFE
ncbi:hypothetical protein FOA52_009726 [Chlamydomonas sp. UWO 241]|nr:hypothetical protein FOA52_009726 [Chlamydomonas sp. UWO 241]